MSVDLFNSLIVPCALVALIVFFARRSLFWMLREAYRGAGMARITLRAKLRLQLLLLERYLAQRTRWGGR